MIFKQQPLLLLLLLQLQLLLLTSAQTPQPKRVVGDYAFDILDNLRSINRVSVPAPYNPANTTLTLNCKVQAPKQFVAWIHIFQVVSDASQLQIKLTPQSYEDPYLCVMMDPAKPKEFMSVTYVINEMPSFDDNSVIQETVPLRAGVRLHCRAPYKDGRTIAWYKYDMNKNMFVKMDRKDYNGGGINDHILIEYHKLSYPYDQGFTYYKCESVLKSTGEADADTKPSFFKVNKENLLDNANPNRPPQRRYEINAQAVVSSVCVVPTQVYYGSRASIFSFKSIKTNEVTWYFRPYIPNREDNEYVMLNKTDNIGFTIWHGEEKAVMSVANFTQANEGYYMKVERGLSTNYYAYVRLHDFVPYIVHDYNLSVFIYKNSNGNKKVICEIPPGGDVDKVIWQVQPQQSAPFNISIDGQRNGFSVSRPSGSSKVVLQFKHNPSFVGYRLQCHLGDRFDSTKIVQK